MKIVFLVLLAAVVLQADTVVFDSCLWEAHAESKAFVTSFVYPTQAVAGPTRSASIPAAGQGTTWGSHDAQTLESYISRAGGDDWAKAKCNAYVDGSKNSRWIIAGYDAQQSGGIKSEDFLAQSRIRFNSGNSVLWRMQGNDPTVNNETAVVKFGARFLLDGPDDVTGDLVQSDIKIRIEFGQGQYVEATFQQEVFDDPGSHPARWKIVAHTIHTADGIGPPTTKPPYYITDTPGTQFSPEWMMYYEVTEDDVHSGSVTVNTLLNPPILGVSATDDNNFDDPNQSSGTLRYITTTE